MEIIVLFWYTKWYTKTKPYFSKDYLLSTFTKTKTRKLSCTKTNLKRNVETKLKLN